VLHPQPGGGNTLTCYLFHIHSSIALSSTHTSFKWPLSFRFSDTHTHSHRKYARIKCWKAESKRKAISV